MSFLIHPAIPPVRIKRIILAAGCRCELCGKETFAADMDVHTIGTTRAEKGDAMADVEQEILVLCPRCHQDLHELGTGECEQRALLSFRTPEVSDEIRKILATTQKHYVPPEVDLEETFSRATRLDTHYRGM
ncbi:MAG: HNH endonuclease [Methanomicrobiales archaeon]|nr:HNH endonuclease [Methanomicrobiales archaeon]MDD1654151.1 HNH endonuclease [Methanomicrobiales archaeon]